MPRKKDSLDQTQIERIKKLYHEDVPPVIIAERFGITRSAIYHIIKLDRKVKP